MVLLAENHTWLSFSVSMVRSTIAGKMRSILRLIAQVITSSVAQLIILCVALQPASRFATCGCMLGLLYTKVRSTIVGKSRSDLWLRAQFIPTSPETSLTPLTSPGSSGTRTRQYAPQPGGRAEALRSARKPDSPSQTPVRHWQHPYRWLQNQ